MSVILAAVPMAAGWSVFALCCTWLLARPLAERRRHHEQWSRLRVE